MTGMGRGSSWTGGECRGDAGEPWGAPSDCSGRGEASFSERSCGAGRSFCSAGFGRHSGGDFFLFPDFGRSFFDGRGGGDSSFGADSERGTVGGLDEAPSLCAEESGRGVVEEGHGEVPSVAGESPLGSLTSGRGEVDSLCVGLCERGGGDDWRGVDCEEPGNPCWRGEAEEDTQEGVSERGLLWVATASRSPRGVSGGSGMPRSGGSGSDAGDAERLLDSDRGVDPAGRGEDDSSHWPGPLPSPSPSPSPPPPPPAFSPSDP